MSRLSSTFDYQDLFFPLFSETDQERRQQDLAEARKAANWLQHHVRHPPYNDSLENRLHAYTCHWMVTLVIQKMEADVAQFERFRDGGHAGLGG